MSKANRLKAGKKALNDIEKQGKEIFKLEVVVDDKQNITVNGPINDPLLIMRLLSGAMNVVVDHNFSTAKLNADIEADRKLKEESRIITPGQNNKSLKIIKPN